jgi:late competence protein required for DNA uptake (superfamily II DNA/RNA helicase)
MWNFKTCGTLCFFFFAIQKKMKERNTERKNKNKLGFEERYKSGGFF